MNNQGNKSTGANVSVVPRWFWIVSILGLVWNFIGVAAFFGQMGLDTSGLPAAERAFYESTPAWATAAFAVAVFSGVLGCIALLIRKNWAVSILAASVVGIVVQISHSMLIGNGFDVFGPAGLVLPLLTLSISISLVWLAVYAGKRGWIS